MGENVYTVNERDVRRLLPTIDYSEPLKYEATPREVVQACRAGIAYGFRAVVAFPTNLELVVSELSGTDVLAQCTVGFPSGAVTTATKCWEAEQGLRSGANDFDMVMNVGALKAGDYDRVAADIAEVASIVRPAGAPLKVIIEVGLLTEQEIETAAALVADSDATHVKTCTGFAPGRATLRIIGLLREVVDSRIAIKASGGVASIEDGLAFLDAGASVIAARGWLVDQLQKQNFTL